MNPLLTAGIVFGCLVAAISMGRWLQRVVPQHRLSKDTKDTVNLAMGLVGTMAALLLSLLVSSAKGSFDTTRGQVIATAADIAIVDRVLGLYGPDGVELRSDLRALTEAQVQLMWPNSVTSATRTERKAPTGDAFYGAVMGLPQRDDTQRMLKAQAVATTVDFGRLRALVIAEAVPSITWPLLTLLVAWLGIIYVSFSLTSPRNAVAFLALIASALCVASAIFLILELDGPFSGLIQVSGEPMLKVLAQLGKWAL